MRNRPAAWLAVLTVSCTVAAAPPEFVDVTDDVGLGANVVPETVSRVCLVELNGDHYPDAVINRHRVFLNVADPDSPLGRRFEEVPADKTGLQTPNRGTVAIFVDLDNDGMTDAIVGENIDANADNWEDHGARTGWHRGNGDGTFGARQMLPVEPKTTISIAAGDVNRDGVLDLYFGNTYVKYGASYEAFTNDLLVSTVAADGTKSWTRQPLDEDRHEFTEEDDLGGRPTYGTMILNDPTGTGPMLLELSYGRRWNRAWVLRDGEWADVAADLLLDGDAVMHGRYPDWMKRRAEREGRPPRADEKMFRANGNTFDAAVGDIDGDGYFDILISEITHGWAGASSDRTRILLNAELGEGRRAFVGSEQYTLDRIPASDPMGRPVSWNQGDLFCALADLDHDARLDVILSSGDYPDNQRLRVYLHELSTGILHRTDALGLKHDGSQQISLGDIDADGDLDILVGQTFNRFTKEQREGRTPQIRVFANDVPLRRPSIWIRLHGDGESVNTNAIGTLVTANFFAGRSARFTMQQVVGPGGHAGKQHDFAVHFGLEQADRVQQLVVTWPASANPQVFRDVAPGRYELTMGGDLVALDE